MNLKGSKRKLFAVLIAALTLSVLIIGSEAGFGKTARNPVSTAALQSNDNSSYRSIYLYIEIDGNVIEGESPVASLERGKLIPVFSVNHEMSRPVDSSSSEPGTREHKSFIFTKEIDKTSPLLAKALTNNEPVTKAQFKFYRPSQSGAGTEEHYYTITLESGYIVSMVTFTDSVDPYHYEEISISFSDITWTYEIGEATHRDQWHRTECE